jgi:prepilin-type N-terminal cleavage/methylation domain-containing protein
MLSKLKKNNNSGFTIIEVMIVLAIAGLILLIVFLAVPALQRNSRNTQRKNDVSSILGAINEYTSNNSGALPTTCAEITALAKTGYYTSGCGAAAGDVSPAALLTGAQAAMAATAANDRVSVITGAQCVTPITGATIAGSARQVAVQYMIETAGAWTPTCQAS